MGLASSISSLYFVTCTLGGVCNEQRSVDFIELAQNKPVQSCETFSKARPVTEEFALFAKAEGYKVSLRCDSNTEGKVKETDATAVAYLTSCGPKDCTTDKLAMFNDGNTDVTKTLDDCDSAAELLSKPFVAKRKAQGYTKFSYSCFPTAETQ
jgi:hypothetical protein